MDAARDQFAARGCSVLVVSQAKPDVLSRYLARFHWHVPIVCDPERNAHAAFGLERTSWLTFFNPRVLWGYFRGMFKGYRVKTPYKGEDLLQLGGDFILTRERQVVFAYPSADPVDRPSLATLLDALPSVPPMAAEPPCPIRRRVDTSRHSPNDNSTYLICSPRLRARLRLAAYLRKVKSCALAASSPRSRCLLLLRPRSHSPSRNRRTSCCRTNRG